MAAKPPGNDLYGKIVFLIQRTTEPIGNGGVPDNCWQIVLSPNAYLPVPGLIPWFTAICCGHGRRLVAY
jgi:hypothetical protein